MLNRIFFVCALLLIIPAFLCAQQKDSLVYLTDTLKNIDSSTAEINKNINDSTKLIQPVGINDESGLSKVLSKNIYLNSQGEPVSLIQSPRKKDSKDVIFYSLASLVLLFGILKFSYPRYFSNLFRVFFNTSLRQSQLTDQLLQAKLPSLFYNIFFILMGGWYLFLLLNYFEKTGVYSTWQVLVLCASSLASIYFVKFCTLKFTGWVTGYNQEADTYIFIIFLINKIVAICLIPLIIIIAFSEKFLVDIAVIASYIIILVMILTRFLRSYSLLQNKIKVSRFHFFIYLTGIEIIPLLMIYKLALIFMNKNL